MPTPVAMPKLGITMEEGTVVEWTKTVGAPVTKGEVILLIESEKAEVEVDAPATGFFRHCYVEPGETVPCGTLLAAITESPDEVFDPSDFATTTTTTGTDTPRAASTTVAARPPTVPHPRTAMEAPSGRRAGRRPATPAARVRARALAVDLARVQGTGPGGRITRGDVEDWAERRRHLVEVEDGLFLEVPRAGRGEPLLLLPGLGTDVSVFAPQIPALAERYEVLGVNPRGVGGSDAPVMDGYTVATAAADAIAVAGGPAHIVGASLGAAVAIEIALRFPDRVRSLTLVTPFVTADARLGAVSDAWVRLAAIVTPDVLARALLPWFFSGAFLADVARRERVVRGLTATVARVPAATVRRALAGLETWSGTRSTDLAAITAPTLVIAAGADLLTPDAPAIGAAIPGASCHVVPNAGHAVTIESPDDVSRALLAHLAQHS